MGQNGLKSFQEWQSYFLAVEFLPDILFIQTKINSKKTQLQYGLHKKITILAFWFQFKVKRKNFRFPKNRSFTLSESPEIWIGQNRSPIFWHVVLIMNIMEKELKSCTDVLLRADLTGHGKFSQSVDFCQKGWNGCTLFYYYICTTYRKIGDLFYPVIFVDFCTVCLKMIHGVRLIYFLLLLWPAHLTLHRFENSTAEVISTPFV